MGYRMAPSPQPFRFRSLAFPGRLVLSLFLVLWAAAVHAQNWTFRPVFSLGAGYDSNAVYVSGASSPGDYFGGLGVRAPLSGRLSQRTTISANYAINGEWYQDLETLNTFPSSQSAALSWSYADGEVTTFSLGGRYSMSRRPEEVFPDSGLAYLRGKTENLGGYTNFGRRLSERTRLTLGYNYERPLFEPTEGFERQAQGHTGTASLGRDLKPGSSLAVRYKYQLYERPDLPRDESHVVGLAYTHAFGRSTTFSLFGGARFASGEVRPDAAASLGHAWRSSQITASYAKNRNYIPTTGTFSDTDNAGLTYSFSQRRFRLTLFAGYSRNRFEDEFFGLNRDLDSYRGSLDTVYMIKHWLGLGATYQYNWQRSGDTDFDNRSRHLVQAGLVVAPWSGTEAQGLR